MTLKEFFAKNNKIALAFSGGTDSSFLLFEGVKCGADVTPYFVKTAFQPQFELDDALAVAKFVNVELKIINKDVLANETVASNPSNRCYFCKRVIFEALCEQAKIDGYSVVIDGTNASDDEGDRPGMRALQELRVLSPLRDCGITKADVRKFSKEAGLFTYKKKSYSCLATRIPSGTKITAENLDRIEKSENILEQMGFVNFRIRDCGTYAKIQIEKSQFELAISHSDEIVSTLKMYFGDVYLDLCPRKTGD